MKKLIITAALVVASLGAHATDARVTAATPRGGVVRFTGLLIGEAVDVAQRHCVEFNMHAVPLGFFPSGAEQLMTFQCVK